jgi:hypothetical protein
VLAGATAAPGWKGSQNFAVPRMGLVVAVVLGAVVEVMVGCCSWSFFGWSYQLTGNDICCVASVGIVWVRPNVQ